MHGTRIFLLGALVAPALALAFPYAEDPQDQVAQAAAVRAVKALGAGRGGISILPEPGLALRGEVIGIVGLDKAVGGSGVGLNARVEALEAAMENLGASVEDTLIRVDLSSDVLFDFDRFDLRPEADEAISDLVVLIENHTILSINIVGHTDAKGSDSYNLSLSLKRANAVKQRLTEAKIDAALIQVDGRGESEPVAPNQNADGSDDPEGRAKNRRVSVIIETSRKN